MTLNLTNSYIKMPSPQISPQDKLYAKNERLASILKAESSQASDSYKELLALNAQLQQLSKTNIKWITK